MLLYLCIVDCVKKAKEKMHQTCNVILFIRKWNIKTRFLMVAQRYSSFPLTWFILVFFSRPFAALLNVRHYNLIRIKKRKK